MTFSDEPNRWGQRTLLAAAGAALLYITGWAVSYAVPLPKRLDAEDSTVVTWRDGTAAHVFLSEDDRWRIPVDLERIDPDYRRALLALEDSRFWWHPGVDPFAVVRAAASNLVAGRVVSGASTVTMQLVRLLEPRPRTLRSKVVEAFRALQLEYRFSKREILESYLAHVSYGKNWEGVETASYLYFDKSAEELSPTQIATLLAVPQAPSSRFPSDENASPLRDARDRIAETLVDAGAFERADADVDGTELLDRVRRSDVPTDVHDVPDAAPHAAAWLRARHPDLWRIRTTLDADVQSAAKRQLNQHRRRLRAGDIHNGAAVVVEHDTAAVRALVGNFSFWDPEHGGQIPGFAVRRSTGSLLKPFIYASALERGDAAPSHLVLDVPRSFAGFEPGNFADTYSGLVELQDALSLSRNIPFVDLLREIGLREFLGLVRQLGASSFEHPSQAYGLGVAVGGLALSPLEVADLYMTLARHGANPPLRIRRPSSNGASEPPERSEAGRVFSTGTTWLTNRALRQRDRPDFPRRRDASGLPTGIHWKTGTSARNRDAWSAGFGPDYTAAVWVGNLDNRRSPALVGASAAGPVFFDLLESIEQDPTSLPPRPDDLSQVEVCALSGHLPTDACPRTEEVAMPTHSVASETCPFHVERTVELATGYAVPPGCDAAGPTRERHFVEIPAEAARWMKKRLGRLPRPPAYKPDCRDASRSAGPRIVSPPADHALTLIPGMPRSEQTVALEAQTSSHGTELHWFVDGELFRTADADETVWWTPEQGVHEIVVTDGTGASDARKLVVEHPARPTIQ